MTLQACDTFPDCLAGSRIPAFVLMIFSAGLSFLCSLLKVQHIFQQVSDFILAITYYNRLRLHSVLDYVAPDGFNSGQAA
jgi:hypothetical protein